MASRSVGWLICFFVALVTASNYREPVSITDWSVLGSGHKFEETAGSTHLIVDRAIVAAQSPALSTMLEHHAVGASSGLGAVPVVEDPLMQQMFTLLHTLQAVQVPNMAPQLPNMDPQLPVMSAQLPNRGPQQSNMVPQLSNMSPVLLSSPSTDGVTHLKLECEQQHLSAETAVAVAVQAIKLSCDSQRQAAVGFIKDHIGQVLGTQGWAHAVRTQPEEVVQLSRLLAERITATRTPAAAHTTTTTTTTTPDQPQCNTASPAVTCPTTPLDEEAISSLRTPAAAHTTTTTTTNTPDQPQSNTASPAVTCPTTPLDEEAISSLRALPEEERGRLLISVAKEGEVDSLRTLLAAGANPGQRDTIGRTALQWSARRGQVVAARCLLDAGADVETTDNEECRPIHMAAMAGHPAMVRFLASVGAELNAKDVWGSTPLHMAVRDHRPKVTQALLEVGADKEVLNERGLTPLILARKANNQPLIHILTQN